MAKLDLGELGRVGVTLDVRADGGHLDDAALLEKLGYSTIWIAGGQLATLDPLRDVVRATDAIPVGSAIIPVQRYAAQDVIAFRRDLEVTAPGRLITGLGGAHGARPLRTMNAYLDSLDSFDAADPPVPAGARMLSALGPRMLELSRDRAAGAVPLLVTPEYTAQARETLGEQPTLAVMEYVVLERDPRLARDTVREPIRFLTRVGGYAQNLRRMGFTDEDIAVTSDRLLDGLVAWGDIDAVAARVRRHLDAGADQVVLVVQPTDPDAVLHGEWRALAEALLA
ncbi:TIGR03620 family F420-dependent LLM class oxidoreductase [Prauserella endophytica]|uniref:TIGR03620 family F420-dependent LLM class oxidoreductase n=1 Tax=Prauserella endophytica TaxID=1592324 RepID=A0ABY2S8Y5_9PSEU|nr:TIGR03620 family F420-dependent LLM class oxidoreductase [Prauserella endophytica]TKG72297.1 TIGR03620 family F420-dependent LLM class oxidoreductase [Prauserella endophytica]